MADQKPEKASHLVVVGSSAGGIEALSTLLGSLPAQFPAAVVLAQHLDPARPSYLPSILERKTPLPVVLVEKQTPLENGKVYLVPANRHVVIEDGQVNMEADHADRPRPSVDLLLSSAARSYGEQLVAVILTGSGSDGAAGAVDVKAAGGVVVIQNPATAAHPSMPAALPPTVVDHIADLESLGPLLQGLVSDLPMPAHDAAERENVMTPLLEMVSRHASIEFQSYKPSTIVRRIGRRMAVNNISSLQEYYRFAQGNRDELGELARSFLIKVTEFFRDPEAFDYIKREILPPLLEGARGRGRVLRLWSAGCATGEEAYSLALLASDVLGKEIQDWNVRIFATDLDEAAVNFARRGLYPANVLRYIGDEYKEKYFERAGPGYRVRKSLRQLLIFGQQDLARGAPFPRIDLVVCRNLLIYFKPELQQDLLDLFAYALHQNAGYLFLGKAETARPRGSFDLVNKKWKVYRCMSGPAATPPGPRLPGAADRPRRVAELAVADGPGVLTDVNLELHYLRRLNELVLRYLPLGVVVLDRSYRILSLNATARRVLNIREPVTEQDFLHAVRALPYAAVRDAIDRVFREKTVQTLADVELEGSTYQTRRVSLMVAPVSTDGLLVEMVVLGIGDTTELTELREQVRAAQSDHQHLVEELGSSNSRLMRTNEELQEANEALQGANEELLLAQEELQATNEEFEATNEELQGTNEELETNNEELQATNEELEATNEELNARSAELQELTGSLSVDRLRLSKMFEAAPFSILVLRGADLTVYEANARSGPIFGPEVVGRPLAEVCAAPDRSWVLDGVREAYEKGAVWTGIGDAVDASAARALFTAVPTYDAAGAVSGVVLYVQDETTP
jgi:two-component system, chemotaxis family, CheB/CheR fusion protein